MSDKTESENARILSLIDSVVGPPSPQVRPEPEDLLGSVSIPTVPEKNGRLLDILRDKLGYVDRRMQAVSEMIYKYDNNPKEVLPGGMQVRSEINKQYGGIGGARETRSQLRGERWALVEAISLIKTHAD